MAFVRGDAVTASQRSFDTSTTGPFQESADPVIISVRREETDRLLELFAFPPPSSEFALDQSNIRPGIWQVICQDATGIDARTDAADIESILPVYEPASKRNTTRTSLEMGTLLARGDRSPDHSSGLLRSLSSTSHRSFLQMEPHETFTYTYNLFAGNTHLQIFILVESESSRSNHYTFSLSMKLGHVERSISNPVTMKLSLDPRGLDFVVFAFPPRTSLPAGSLFHLRVWLRTAGVDHRIFGAKDLWFGKDPDFRAIADASFAFLRNATQNMLIYQAIVGHAHVSFIVRWKPVEPGVYALSLGYEAGGAGRTLFENYQLRLYCDPQTVSFLIYSIPVASAPPGASHRLRFWLRTPQLVSKPSASSAGRSPHPTESNSSYLYQRLWKSDDFKIGAHLNFESIGSKIILATRQSDDPPTFDSTLMPLTPNRRRVSRLAPNVGIDETGESVNDR